MLTKQATAHRSRDLAWLLVLENLIFAAEAEVRWLDHVETRLHQESLRAPAAPLARPTTVSEQEVIR